MATDMGGQPGFRDQVVMELCYKIHLNLGTCTFQTGLLKSNLLSKGKDEMILITHRKNVMTKILNGQSMQPYFWAVMLFVVLTGGIYAQGLQVTPELKAELDYIQALNTARMPDYAELVLNQLEAKYPEAKAHLKAGRLELILQSGRFDDAKALIAKERNQEAPEAWAMKLTLADYYYVYGRYNEALGIYKGLFEKYKAKPPVEIASFYKESFYKYAQMLLFLGLEKEALVAYKDMLGLDMELEMKRQVQFEAAQLKVRLAEKMPPGKERDAFLDLAKRRTEDILWVQDLWFGRGIVLLAHIEVLKGDVEGANKLVKTYMGQLRNIDRQLQEQSRLTGEDLSRLSPIAECRYLIGSMMQDEANKELEKSGADLKKAGELLKNALTEMVNVYVRYPSTTWAPDALTRSDEIQALLKERFGVRDIQIDITPEQRRTIAEKQFANARMLFNQQQFENAVDAYGVVLNQFPDAIPESIDALSEYARAYIQLGDTQKAEEKQYSELCEEMIIGHLAERFSQAPTAGMIKAGDELRRIAEFYGERNEAVEREATYQLFFELYSDHPLAAPVLMSAAEKLYREEDYAGAIPRYTTLMDFYQKSPLSFEAMVRLADCYLKLGDTENEIGVRKTYVERLKAREKPGQDLITGMYMLARANRAEAIRALREANVKFDDARRAGTKPPAETDSETDAEAADPLDVALDDIKRANQALVASVNDYGEIVKLLAASTRKQYEENTEEKERNDSILQGALYDRSYTLTLITQPVEQLPRLKTMAIRGYEALLTQFPETSSAPAILMQMGTLWSTMKTDDAAAQAKNMKKADELFSRLSKEFPDSEQARNAYFMRGRTLIELGYRREGVEVLKKMFSDSGNYSATQMRLAAEELLASKEYELAREGFGLAMKMAPDNAAISVSAQIGIAEILVAEKKFTEAADALDAFIAANPTSYRVLDANLLLSRAAAQAAFEEKDRNSRIKLFNRAIEAIRAVRPYRKGAKNLADIEMEVGSILETKAEVERKYDNPELVRRYIGEAASHYQKFLMGTDKRNAELHGPIELAYRNSLKLMLEMKTYADGTPVYEDVKADCEAYLSLFPNGRFVTDVRAFATEAEIGLSTIR